MSSEYMIEFILYIAPSIAPMNFEPNTTTADNITFRWTPLNPRQANGLVSQYIITCNESLTFNVSINAYIMYSVAH